MTYQAMHIQALEPDDAVDTFGERGHYNFGAFVAWPASRDLRFAGEQVCIGSRAFDLLIVLLRSQGEIVTKEQIFRHVWPSTTVDESNLRFQMATLRKILGCERERVKTIPGRGYLFAADNVQPQSQATPMIEHTDRGGTRPAIVIIDEDPQNRAALQHLLRPFHALVKSFGSMEAFLADNAALSDRRKEA